MGFRDWGRWTLAWATPQHTDESIQPWRDSRDSLRFAAGVVRPSHTQKHGRDGILCSNRFVYELL